MNQNKKSRTPVKTVLFMTGATILSKLLGMLRGVIFAAVYEASVEANAFTVASHIPLTCFDLLLSAAILGCFIPVYSGFFDGDKVSEDGENFALIFLNTIILITSLLALVGIIAAKPLVALLAPGLNEETAEVAAKLLRIMFPMIIFTGAAYTLVGVMQTKGRYFLPSMISAISNAAIILYLIIAAPRLDGGGIIGLAVVYFGAWLLQFLTLAIPLNRSGFKFRPKLSFKNPALLGALKQLPPIMAGSWLMPVTIYSGIFFASFITEKVAIFDYANSIYVLVTGILTYSICNYIFPKLSKLSNSPDSDDYASESLRSLKIALTIILPCAAAVAVLYGEGTAIIYMRNSFGADATELTASVVRMMSIGMPFFAANELLSRAFYAKKQTMPPMSAALVGIAVNIAASCVIVNLPNVSIAAIGIPYALGQAASAILLVVLFVGKNRKTLDVKLVIDFIKLIFGGVLALAVMSLLSRLLGNDPYSVGIIRNILCCAAVFIPGAAVYLIYLKIVGIGFDIRKTERLTESEQAEK